MEMKYLDEFREPALAGPLLEKIRSAAGEEPVRLMEVCGTHTMAISRGGIRSLLSGRVDLISGPGCPVCVTPNSYIDGAIKLGKVDNVILASFGDMIKVPGNESTLEMEKANDLDVRIVYSPLDALKLAESEPESEVVFLGVGFETTTPSVAGAILMAEGRGIKNFSVLSSFRTVPEAMEVLVQDPEVKLEGFLCPAHVTTIIGANSYIPITENFGIPCVVAGFEYLDILLGILMLTKQIREGAARVENEYTRVATGEGNRRAQEIMDQVFVKCDATWRGIGTIPSSGHKIRDSYSTFDGERKFGVEIGMDQDETPCRCGDVLKGKITPPECPLFGKSCSPSSPYGPCMVSSEGSCAAFYKYEGVTGV